MHVEHWVDQLVFDAQARAQMSGIKPTQLLLGPAEVENLDSMLRQYAALLPAKFAEGPTGISTIVGGQYFGMTVSKMVCPGVAVR